MQKNSTPGDLRPLAIGLVVLAGLIRITQHWNFAPVGALSLFAGARLRGWKAWALPIAVMAITDPLMGGYSALTPLIYASLLVNVWLGTRLQESESPLAIGSMSLAGSVQFFLLTNFAFLGYGSAYTHNLTGVLACYTAGVPFFWRTLASDLFYSGVLFGLHAWLSRKVAHSEQVAPQAA
jgi:Family of unknown function (DUF6580)